MTDRDAALRALAQMSGPPMLRETIREGEQRMTTFAQYQRSQIAELRPWQVEDDMTGISVSQADKDAGSPKSGDMIARNPKNHADQWLVAAQYFTDNFEPLRSPAPSSEWRDAAEKLANELESWTIARRESSKALSAYRALLAKEQKG